AEVAPDQASTVTPCGLIACAIVQALHEHKVLHAAFDPGSNTVHRYRAVHLGIAVDTPRGLLVPVVHDADRLEALGFLAEVGRLVQAARSGTLAPAELVGSTCSVSNFGAFGLDDGWSLLNPPEAAIVGVGSIRERAVAVDGALAVRTTAKLTCTFDHRVADGADVGGFLGVLAQLIEAPEGLRHG
ncbi:MAG: 2-oxo acid dehydrogenase subunit E2, partial [Acidimicrobiales bacterium]|nr:2-oxo acid dehydrogenase subunit E2 [Acidimicrobiales bacterium]